MSTVDLPIGDPAVDLLDLVNAASLGRGDRFAMIDRDVLVQALSAYIVERDRKVLEHGSEIARRP